MILSEARVFNPIISGQNVNILFRVDASNNIGGGHVIRCLNLAIAFSKKGATVEFLCMNLFGNLIEKIKKAGFACHLLKRPVKNNHRLNRERSTQDCPSQEWRSDANQTLSFLQGRSLSYDIIVVDHYDLDIHWERQIRPFVGKLMVIDDLANRKHECDIFVCQVYGTSAKEHVGLLPPRCQSLFGADYILMNPNFYQTRKFSKMEASNECKIHLFFGTNDIDGLTIRFTNLILKNFSNLKVKVAINGEFPFQSCLARLSSEFALRMEWEKNITDMTLHYNGCSFAFGTPGMSTWERACMGLPALHIINNPSQHNIMEKLEKLGFCQCIGDIKTVSDKQFVDGLEHFLMNQHTLMEMRQIGLRTIDGGGVFRVADFVLDSNNG